MTILLFNGSSNYDTFNHRLDEIDSGVCDGLSYDSIEKLYPLDYMERETNKFNYRYHGGKF